MVTQEIFRRYPRFTFVFFLIAPVVLYSCWVLLIGPQDWFPWVKVFSIALGIILLSIFRNTSLGNSKICQWTVYIFLAINIFEAVARDISGGSTANYLNAIAGVLLVVTLNQINTIHIDDKEGYRDLRWESMTLSWIIGYTLWNWVFVYLNFGFQSSIQHIAVLGPALIIGLINSGRWLQARVLTLGTYFIIIHSVPHYPNYFSLADNNNDFGFWMAIISSGFMAIYTGYVIMTDTGRGYIIK